MITEESVKIKNEVTLIEIKINSTDEELLNKNNLNEEIRKTLQQYKSK